jgi:hypothetical protein
MSFRRGKSDRTECVDINPRVLFESIEQTDGGVASVRRQAVHRLCEHALEDHCLGKISGVDSREYGGASSCAPSWRYPPANSTDVSTRARGIHSASILQAS